MQLTSQRITLRLAHPFTIARGTRTTEERVIVRILHGDQIGYGEAATSARYGENADSAGEFFARADLRAYSDPLSLEEVTGAMEAIAPGNYAAKAAIDIALHDLAGKTLGVPVWKLWGLACEHIPATSFTIGIDNLSMVEQKVREADAYPILKVKVGVEGDEEIVRRVRSLTGKTIRVDANEGWKTKEVALEKIQRLQEYGVELVEQPLPAADLPGMAWLKERVSIPLIADESVRRSGDIPALHACFHGVNIKLMKCGGLREAFRMLVTARSLGLKVMLGCMIETAVGISAAAQLAPLSDYLDLDGNLLILEDPFEGIRADGGHIRLGMHPGIGVREAFPAGRG